MNDGYLDFDEYIRQGEPDKQQKASIWRTAIGLQAVDGLKTSDYLKETARKHIEGEINIDEARELIKSYYQSKTKREPDDDDKQEADKVSANITKILSSETLDFSTKGYIALHRRIFEGVFKHAGKVRDYDITKKEWVLEYDTVNYLNWEDLLRAIDYDIAQERDFSYKNISSDELITGEQWDLRNDYLHIYNRKTTEMTIEELLEKPYWVIDILPKQVPANGGGQYFKIEEYYLKHPQIDSLYRAFTNILLKLNCYYDFEVSTDGEEWMTNPVPKDMETMVSKCCSEKNMLYIILKSEETMITLCGDDTNMTIYNPTEEVLSLLGPLAISEGFFLWKP